MKNLSPSKVDTYLGCPRQFLYKYIEKPIPIGFNKYFFIGSCVHQIIELFHTKIHTTDIKYWPALMKTCCEMAHQKYPFMEKYATMDLDKRDVTSIQSMCQKYLDYMRKVGLPNTISAEKMFKVSANGVLVMGKADRVDKLEDGSVKIVDYKSSAKPKPKKEAFDSVQLPTYGWWIRSDTELEPDKTVKLYGEYQYIKHLDKKTGVHTFEITDDHIANVVEIYTKVNLELKNGGIFKCNRKYKYCKPRSCDWYDFCKKDKR